MVEHDKTSRKFESIYSTKVRAGKRRTYFFDVRKTKGEDYFVTLTESTRKFNDQGYERHKIFLYKEDFNRFLSSLEETINYIKTNLMPDYDYDEFTKRNEEYEKRLKEEAEAAAEAAEGAAIVEAVEETVEEIEKPAEEVIEPTEEVAESDPKEATETGDETSEDVDNEKDVSDEDMSW